jgi:uncharacterized damage-inducible protein DinB
MTKSDLITLYRFTDWANERLIEITIELPSEAFHRDLGGSFRTIRDVLAHVVSVDWVWLERWKGGSPSSLPDWYTSNEASVLAGELARIAGERSRFLEGLAESDLAAQLTFSYFSGKPGAVSRVDALFHVVNHSTYHRGQLSWMLRAVGTSPPPTDFTIFRAASAS